MTFNPINAMSAGMLILLLLPNLIFGRGLPLSSQREPVPLTLLENAGRFGAMLLMVLPLGVWEFGFVSVGAFLLWLFGSAAFLLAYWLVWPGYRRHPSRRRALALALLPCGLFLLTGILLRHWLLTAFALLFTVTHLWITRINTAR